MSGTGGAEAGEAEVYRPAVPERWRNAANFALYQVGWLACVGGAARGWAWAGPAAAGALMALQFSAVSARPMAEARFALGAVAVGIGVEALNRAIGLYAMARPEVAGPWAAALWSATLWAGLATTIPGCLAWLSRAPRWVQAGAGALAGPLAFYGGSRMGAVTLGAPALWVTALAVEWAVALPVLAAFWKRRSPPRPVFAASR